MARKEVKVEIPQREQYTDGTVIAIRSDRNLRKITYVNTKGRHVERVERDIKIAKKS